MNMPKTLKNITLTLGLIALSGCTAFSSFSEVEALNEAQAVGNPFTKALAAEYKMFSNTELNDMFDYPDALHFARKGLAAASGEMVLPEPIADWNLEDGAYKELSAARGRLISVFDMAGREASPDLSARAQGKFDCWIERQEENEGSEAIACKNQFMEALTQLEGSLQAPAPAPAPVEAAPEPLAFDVDASQPMQAENAVYLIFFNWNKSGIGSAATNVLDAVADEVRSNPPNTINIVGHTDTSGSPDYNQNLAFKRANAVKDAMIQRGIDPTKIMVDARGEGDLLVPTPNDVREPANRRVSVSFN